MKLNTYLACQRAFILIQYLLFPLFMLLRLFVPFFKRRYEFEKDHDSKSFKASGVTASHCFHVSSEGELEQCMSIMLSFLGEGHYVELVYTSDSVAKKCDALAREFKKLNILRMPLVSFPLNSFRRWVSAKSLFMCRYDFFSELMLYGSRHDVNFILLSGSLKGKSSSGPKGFFFRGLYKSFNLIIAASEVEKERFLSLEPTLSVDVYEFRLLQIAERLSLGKKKLDSVSKLDKFLGILSSRDPLSNLIIGSAWPVELDIFKDKKLVEQILSGELLVTIAPHSLKKESITTIIEKVSIIAPKLKCVLAEEVVEYRKGEVYLNITPGILLETYIHFGHVLVGGGYGRSIHSVLEPYLAGARVYCGPKVYRSTEFDFIKKESPNDVVIINDLDKVSYSLLPYAREQEIVKRRELVLSYKEHFKKIMDKF